MAKYEWQEPDLTEREAELDESLTTYDPAKDIMLNPKWDGVYKFRILPVTNPRDWLRQAGFHWNLIPTDENTKFSVIGCPQFTYGQDCPICDAINKMIGERKAQYKDFSGEGGIALNRRLLLRVLLIDFQPAKTEKKPPKFDNLPQLKIMQLPAGTVGKALREALVDDDYGKKALFHPEFGRVIKAKRDKGQMGYWTIQIQDPSPIPEEFLEQDEWPELENFLPTTTPDEIRQLIIKHQHDVNPVVVNYLLSTDVPVISAGNQEEKKANLKKKLKEI